MREDEKKVNKNLKREYGISSAQKARYILANENAKRREKQQRRIAVIIVLITCVLSLLAVDIIFFNVREIEVYGNSMYSTDVIISELSIKEGTNMLAIYPSMLETRLCESFPGIQNARVSIKLPSKIKVEISESPPFMYTAVGEFYYTLDKNMVVIEKVKNYDTLEHLSLIRVYYPDVEECIVGNYIKTKDPDITEMLKKLCGELEKTELLQDVVEINILDKFDISFLLGTKYIVKLGNIIDCEIKLEFLNGILKELSEDDVGIIDISDSDIREAIFERM